MDPVDNRWRAKERMGEKGKKERNKITRCEQSQECRWVGIMDQARNRTGFPVPVDDTFSYRQTAFLDALNVSLL
jgi:hypothetical protein